MIVLSAAMAMAMAMIAAHLCLRPGRGAVHQQLRHVLECDAVRLAIAASRRHDCGQRHGKRLACTQPGYHDWRVGKRDESAGGRNRRRTLRKLVQDRRSGGRDDRAAARRNEVAKT